MSMGDKSDSSESDLESLPQGYNGKSIKRPARKDFARRKKRKHDPQQNECEPRKLSPDSSSYPQSSSSDEFLLSDNPPGNLHLFEFSVNENPAIISTSISDPLNDLILFRNPEQSFHVIHNTDNLLQVQPNPIDNLDGSSRKKNIFKPSYIFRDLLHAPNNNEVDEFSCGQRIFQPNFPMDVLSEDKHIWRDIRNIFESEGKLKDSNSQTETWSVHQTIDKDIFQNRSEQNCYDWDKFLERWEDLHIISGSTSEAQHHELKTIEEPEICQPASLTSESGKRKKSTRNSSLSVSFSGQTKKQPCIAESPETAFPFKPRLSDKEHGSNRKIFLPSFEKELEIIVHPVSSETNTSSRLEKFMKNTKIKLLEDDQIPPFLEKIILLNPDSRLPDWTNVSSLSNDSYENL